MPSRVMDFDAPEVVTVRPQAGEMTAAYLVLGHRFEGVPFLSEGMAGAVYRGEERQRSSDDDGDYSSRE